MPTVADYLRAVNAPPVLGDLSAATTQPWLVPGVGTGPGAQLIMKDPAGVLAAATAQSQAAGVANPYAGKVWGDTIGAAQGNALTMRAQDIQAAAAAASRAQQAQQFAAQQQRLDNATRAQAQAAAAWHQADTAQRTRNDTLDFLSSLAKMTGGGGGTGRAAAADALDVYNQTREGLGSSLTGIRDNLAELPNLREQFTYTDPEGRKTLGVSEDVANAMRMVGGWAPDSDTLQNALVGAHASLKRDEYGVKEALNTARDQYQQTLARIKSQPAPGMSPQTLDMLLRAAGLGAGPVSRTSTARPLLVPGWNGSAANDPRYRRIPVDFNATGTYGPQTVEEAMGFTPAGPIDVPTYDRTFSVDAPAAPVTRMQMLPDGSLVPAGASSAQTQSDIGTAFQQALDSSLNKQSLYAPLAAELARLLSVDPARVGQSTVFRHPESQVYDVIRSLSGGDPTLRAQINALPPQLVNQLLQNAMLESRRQPARTVSKLGMNI